MRHCRSMLLALFALLLARNASGQEPASFPSKLLNAPEKLFNGILSKTQHLEQQLDKQTIKYLEKLQRREKKLRQKLAKKDSATAQKLFGNIDETYAKLNQGLADSGDVSNAYRNVYNGHIDSMRTALNFLQTNDIIAGEKLSAVIKQYGSLQNKLNKTEEIKKYLQQRQQFLKAQLAQTGLVKEFRDFQKDVYYYRSQLEEYKSILSDQSKLEAKLLHIAQSIPAFRSFFAKYSALGSMFRLPGGDPLSNAGMAGLQTRDMVRQQLQSTFGSGPDAARMVQQSLQSAQTQLNELKNKLSSPGGDSDIPNFKPNGQKTKSFLKRLETGTNVQTVRGNNYFPVTTDLAFTVGYKINDKSIAGIGASYKFGWGENIRRIKFTSEGVGLRSFLDWQLKGNFYASGGFEYNYQQPFGSFRQTGGIDNWKQSGLLGISKTVPIKAKLFSKTKLQLLWDFLSYQQTPRTQPLLFRVNYAIK